MTARLFGGVLVGALALAGMPASAQHHEAPAARAPKAATQHEPADGHGPKGAPSLGLIAPAAPSVAPVGHGRTQAAAPPEGGRPHDDTASGPPGRRKKVDVGKESHPADVAASISQRLAELAELRRTAPVAPVRRQAPKRENPAPEGVAAAAPTPKPVETPTVTPIKLRWRVPVSWPDEMSAPAHRPGLTSSAGVP